MGACERPGERADNDWFKVKCLAEILLEEAKGGRIVQEIKTIATTPYNSSWSTVSSYWKEKSNEQPGIHRHL